MTKLTAKTKNKIALITIIIILLSITFGMLYYYEFIPYFNYKKKNNTYSNNICHTPNDILINVRQFGDKTEEEAKQDAIKECNTHYAVYTSPYASEELKQNAKSGLDKYCNNC